MGDVRLVTLEHNLHDLHARLMRTEESNTALNTKCQALNDSLVKCLQVLCLAFGVIATLIPDLVEP